MKLKVYSVDGAESGRTVDLDDDVFGIEPNDHAIWLDVRRIQANGRQGTHQARERSEVRGSTRKLYRQKGTGHARAGDVKSPLRRGGGTIFGPRPRSYGIKINRKTQALARRSAVSHKVREDALRVVEDFAYEAPSTRQMTEFVVAQDLSGKRVLLLTAGVQSAIYRSARNVSKLNVKEAGSASTLDLIGADVLIVQEGALDSFHVLLKGKAAETA
jgi:large subunit ribosomal protein L4